MNGNPKSDLEKIYYDISKPGSYSSAYKLWQAVDKKYSLKKVTEFVNRQPVQSKFKGRKKRFSKRRIKCYKPFNVVSLDLMFLPKRYLKSNENIGIVLIAIDCWTKIAAAQEIRNKDASTVLGALKKIMTHFSEKFGAKRIEHIYSDRGTEFKNNLMSVYLKTKKTKQYFAFSAVKAAQAERFIRTLKLRIFKYMEKEITNRWLEALPKIVQNYNETYHSSLKLTPIEALKAENAKIVESNLFGDGGRYKPPVPPVAELPIGTWVRKVIPAKTMSKESDMTFSIEVFEITFIDRKAEPPLYKLSDSDNIPLEGSFYLQELAKSDKIPTTEELRIEKRFRSEGLKTLVKFKGFRKNVWISTANINEYV